MTLLLLLAQLSVAQAPAPEAVRDAFEFLYALPSDTAAAPMGSWVIDSEQTSTAFDPAGVWRIVINRLADTGDALQLREMAGRGGTSPAELEAAAANIQKLEAKISRAEAEAALEVTINAANLGGFDVVGPWKTPVIPGAIDTRLVEGKWQREYDRELEAETERWSPSRLFVRIGAVSVIARGNQEMIDRLIKETRWNLLAAPR